MAKVKYGAIVGQVSGSIGASTHGHNRFGNYIRQRSIPVQPNTGLQLWQRSVLGSESAAWGLLLAAQQLSWKVWAENNPIVDSLGDKRILTGHMAFVACNSRLKQIALPTSASPPITPHPLGLNSLSITASAATQVVTHTFSVSPLVANTALWIRACKTPKATINYVKNLLSFVQCSSAGGGSPWDSGAYAAKVGTLVQNERLITWISILDLTNGLISPPIEARCTIGA
jgi:hypothetical protein